MLLRKVYLIKHGCTMSLSWMLRSSLISKIWCKRNLNHLKHFLKLFVDLCVLDGKGLGGSRKKSIGLYNISNLIWGLKLKYLLICYNKSWKKNYQTRIHLKKVLHFFLIKKVDMNVDNLFLAFNCIKIQWLLSVCLIMRCVCIVKKVSCFGMSKVRPYERKRECVWE